MKLRTRRRVGGRGDERGDASDGRECEDGVGVCGMMC